MNIKKEFFGKTPDGKDAYIFTLSNEQGMMTKISNYGGLMTHLMVPDKSGKSADVILGFNALSDYFTSSPYFGALIGRYGNRIAKGKFMIGHQTFTLAINNGENHLHGGLMGFDKVIWNALEIKELDKVGLKLTYLSKDMEEGYPGNLQVTVTYLLTNQNEIKIEYEATTDKATHINLTQHNYYNLTGCKNNVLKHELFIDADHIAVVDNGLIPTGEIKNVKNTPFDFTAVHTIGERIDQISGGYDHNYVLNKKGREFALIANVYEPMSGRNMEVYTTEPGVQLYTAGGLDGSVQGKDNITYNPFYAFCLETQHFPDSPNHPEFPSTLLNPGEKYHQLTVYKFSAK
jgi:aldose 1-epimerase